MTPPEGIYFPRPRSSLGWFYVALLLMAAAAVWLWSERREKPDPKPRIVGVVEADSSGIVTTPDTTIVRGPGEPIPPSGPSPVPPEIFVAPAPTFQSPSAVPVGNFLDYARQMQFDPTRGQDVQLPVDEFGREPVVHLEPLTNLRRLDSLAFAQGRILARIRSELVPVASLGLRAGDNFLWVRGTLGTTVTGELWSTSALASPRQITLTYSLRAPSDVPAGKDAWWVGDDVNGRQLWIVCGRGWCHN